MKFFNNKTRLLTPAVSPDAAIDRSTEAKAVTTGRGATHSFDDAYAAASAYYTPETVSYTPLDRETLSGLIAESLRPAYDQAIENRQRSTAAVNANLDADAWSRGIGQSSYVTDVKSRNYQSEARDVGTLEASYGAALAQQLFNALSAQESLRVEVDMFNAQQIDTAKNRAYQAATALYKASSGSGSSKTAAQSASPAISMQAALRSGLYDVAAYDAIETSPAEDAELYWKLLTPEDREKLYNAETQEDARTLASIEKSVGIHRLQELLREYPTA